MALISEVGKIIDSRVKAVIDWEIPNYTSLSQDAGINFRSPLFYFLNSKWCITIYPNGQKGQGRDSVDWIDMYLEVLSPTSTYPVTFELGIKNLKTKIGKGPGTRTFSSDAKNYGWEKICLRNDILRFINEESTNGTLVVYCEACKSTSSITDAVCQTPFDSTALLCWDLADLLQSGHNSDMTIDVCGHIFKVHRLILEARSPVFAAMFEHDMKEKNESIIKISDCDPDTFKYFLHYIYTGGVMNLSWNHVIDLFEVSDKYCMTDLKKQCVEFMSEDLSLENACDVLVVADTHNEIQLMKSAEEFLVKNMKIIKSTDKWKLLMIQNSSLAFDILLKCIPDE